MLRFAALKLRRIALLVILTFGLAAWPAAAQNPAALREPSIPEKAGKELRAYRIEGDAPRIDGRFDEEVWAQADLLDDMVQNEPDNMAAPTERTIIQVAYDDRSLYVAVRCLMRDASEITTSLGRRDAMPPSDVIRLTFDPRHDHLTAYTFDSNPSGTQSDYLWYDDTRQSS